MNKNNLKWFTISEFVDSQTGEMISKDQVGKNKKYYKLKSETKNEIDWKTKTGFRKIINICVDRGQTEIEFK